MVNKVSARMSTSRTLAAIFSTFGESFPRRRSSPGREPYENVSLKSYHSESRNNAKHGSRQTWKKISSPTRRHSHLLVAASWRASDSLKLFCWMKNLNIFRCRLLQDLKLASLVISRNLLLVADFSRSVKKPRRKMIDDDCSFATLFLL